ncbi:MAG: hypothetical protein H7Z38_08450 [Rubrivivax sp.]|nr:hypothetical protein [Pyrinomonadaceae bacterium]
MFALPSWLVGRIQPTAKAASIFTVTSTGDGADSDTADGVCNDGTGQCTLRAAIQQANQLAGDDVINITITGTISLSSVLPNLSNLTITGPGPAQLTVSRDPNAATKFRIFRTDVPATVNIFGITISGGRVSGDGGGIYSNSGTKLTLSNVVIRDNVTEASTTTDGRGAGVYHTGSSLTLANCTVSSNSASNGISSGGSDGRNGGGIYLDRGTLNVLNSTISSNKAGNRAGFNAIPGFGGGVYISSAANGATFTNSTISGNQSGQGGGGGGIYNANSSAAFPLTLNSCTITGNTVGTGNGAGGVFSLRTNIRNTIVANNPANTNPDIGGTFNSQDFNLIRNPGDATITGTTSHNVTGVDPLLSPLQNNGGPTQTHALLSSSPAIDAGDSGGLTTDQRGLTRPVDNAAAANASDGSDIGAYEGQAAPAPGQLQFGAASYTAAEGAGNVSITVTRTGGGTGIVSVTFATSNGTAVADADYTAISNQTVTFEDGDTTSKTVNVFVTDDLLDESDETVNFTLSNPTGGATLIGSPTTATLTITDNDAEPTFSVNNVTVTEGNAGRTPVDFVVSLSGPSGKTVSVEYGPGDGTATASGAEYDFEPRSGKVTFAPGETSKTATVLVRGDARVEPDETFFLNLSFPINGIIGAARGVGTILNDDSPATKSVQFSDYQFLTREGPFTTTVTLYRVGDLSAEASVDYSTADETATDRGDYTSAFGRVTFPAGSDFAHFNVFVTDDRFHEGDETFTLTLSNPSGVTLGAGSTTTLIITRDDDATDGTSPITLGPSFDITFFVRQHYRDFLGRDSDSDGQQFWFNEINNCGADAQCREVKSINVSAAFFLSIEFQETGFLVERVYKTAFGDAQATSSLGGTQHPILVPIVRLGEFLPDTQRIGQGVIIGQSGADALLEANKNAFALEFVQRPRFLTAFPLTMTPAQVVDTMNQNAGSVLTQGQRDALVAQLTASADVAAGRASVLRQIAENQALKANEKNRAFVLEQFFGYLRRNPNDAPDTDYTGYEFWLQKLNQFGGNFVQAEMVKAFITSTEYRQRFGL